MGSFSSLLLLFVASAYADYDAFFFSTAPNGTATCPDLGFACEAPDNVCAHDRVRDKYYCCSGDDYPICRTFASTCGGSNGGPSSSQTECIDGQSSWCCLSGVEQCTQRSGQINICVATQENIIANLSQQALDEAYSSLLPSPSPSGATTLTFDATSLAQAAVSTSGSSTSTTSSSATASASASASSTPFDEDDGLSGGAIAGIAIGCVGGLAAVGIGAWFFLWRPRRKAQLGAGAGDGGYSSVPYNNAGSGNGYDGTYDGTYYNPKTDGHAAPQHQVAEMEGTRDVNELPPSERQMSELPAQPAKPGELYG